MLRHLRDAVVLLTGETDPKDTSLRTRWGLAVAIGTVSVSAVLYVVCRLRWIQNVFLQDSCAVALVSCLATWALVPVAGKLAWALGAVDRPGGRRIHRVATPRLGGAAVFGGVCIAALLVHRTLASMTILIAASGLVFVVSLVDDVRGTPAWVRLAVQVGACLVLIAGGLRVSILPASLWGDLLEYLVTIVWLVGIANAVNFLDGMNGLVPGLTAITSGVFGVLALRLGQHSLAFCAVALSGAQLAFLGFNIKPARMFLGDCGSITSGFFMAGLAIMGNWSPADVWVSSLVPVLVLSVPIYDMIFTTVSRVSSGKVTTVREWLEYTGRDHIHHRLNRLGLSRAQTVVVIWFLNTVVALSSVPVIESHGNRLIGLVAVTQASCTYLIFALLETLGLRKHAPAQANADQTQDDGPGH